MLRWSNEASTSAARNAESFLPRITRIAASQLSILAAFAASCEYDQSRAVPEALGRRKLLLAGSLACLSCASGALPLCNEILKQ